MIAVTIDRGLGVPVRQQIRAALINDIARGALRVGDPLPSVRDLAESLRVAPATVSQVYAELKESGLVSARMGAGTYVARCALTLPHAREGIAGILDEMDRLVDRATEIGLPPADIVSALTARAVRRVARVPRPGFVVVGLFPDATRSYADCIAGQVGEAASVTPVVLGPEPAEPDPNAVLHLRGADLIITFASLNERIAAIAPETPIVGLRFIPAETTRLALASLDPMARVAVVSRFADFLPVLELGVRRFAPHVANVTALEFDAPGLAQAVAECSVVVASTGAEAAFDLAPPAAGRIEYRHIPDPGDVARLILPRLSCPGIPVPERPARGGRKEAS